MPRLITEGGTGVALPYLAAAMNEPVDCQEIRQKFQEKQAKMRVCM